MEGEDPGCPSGIVEGEDIPDSTRNLTHGQTLDLEQGSCSELVGCAQTRNRRGRRTHRIEMIELHDHQDEGGVAGKLLLQSSPELRFANRSGPGLRLGIQTRRRLQASKLLP